MSFAAISIGTAVASSGYKIYDSARKSSQANELAASNQRPIYERPEEIDDVYNLALSEVNNTQEEDMATQQLQLNASAGIDAILKSGGRADFGVINNTYGTQLRAALSSLQRQRDARIAAANNAAYNLGQAKDAEFQYNEDAPYKDKKQAEAQLRQQAEQSKMDAINGLTSTASNLALANLTPGQYGNKGVSNTPNLPGRVDIGRIDTTVPAPTFQRPQIGSRTIPNPTEPVLQDLGYDENQNQVNWKIDYIDEFGNPVYRR